MTLHRLLFVVTLYLMAVASFVIFISHVVPWTLFRLSSQPATLVLQPDPTINGPDDERKFEARRRTMGEAVVLTLATGTTIATHARLTTQQFRRASSASGLRVLFRNAGPDRVQVIGDLDDLDSPWIWLVLCALFAIVAPYARGLLARERT